MSIWIQLNPAFSICVWILLKLGPTRTGGNARLLRNASFQPRYLTQSTGNSVFMHCSRTHKFHFSVTFLLKMGLTALFTHLKIILLQCFQFQFSVSVTISSIQTDPKYELEDYSITHTIFYFFLFDLIYSFYFFSLLSLSLIFI